MKLPNWYNQPVEQKALEQINAIHTATAKENVCTSKTVGNDKIINLQSLCAACINYVKGNSHVTQQDRNSRRKQIFKLIHRPLFYQTKTLNTLLYIQNCEGNFLLIPVNLENGQDQLHQRICTSAYYIYA